MAGEVRIGGNTASVKLQGNDSITTDQTFTYPDTGGEVVVSPGTADIETTGSLSVAGNLVVKEGSPYGKFQWTTRGGAGVEQMTVYNGSGDSTATITSDGSGMFQSAPGLSPESGAGWSTKTALRLQGSWGGAISLVDGVADNSPGYCIWLNDSGANINIGGKADPSSGGLGGAGVALAGHAATSWTSRSDERDKENLVEITDGLNKVAKLRAMTGNMIEAIDPSKTKKAFLIAQDVLEVQPEAVSLLVKAKLKQDQRYGVAYTEVIPLLVSALHDAKDRIEALEAEVQALKGGAS